MNKITLEKTHVMLEKLAEYIMNEVPTKHEMNIRFEHVNLHIKHIDNRLERLEPDVKETKNDVKMIIEGMDVQAKELHIIRTEQVAIGSTLDRHEKRITALGEKETGYRIRDKDE